MSAIPLLTGLLALAIDKREVAACFSVDGVPDDGSEEYVAEDLLLADVAKRAMKVVAAWNWLPGADLVRYGGKDVIAWTTRRDRPICMAYVHPDDDNTGERWVTLVGSDRNHLQMSSAGIVHRGYHCQVIGFMPLDSLPPKPTPTATTGG